MIECTHFAPMLTARPGELAAQDAMALERHLDACIDCRALRATFLATEGLLAEGLLARAAERDFAPFTDSTAMSPPPGQRVRRHSLPVFFELGSRSDGDLVSRCHT